MSFLNPFFLFGLLAASIPIVIHLFTRRRPREVQFSTLEFLSEVNQSEIRRLKIKQWLLLLLRALAVAAIALAMSRPALRGDVGLKSGAATTVVVLVDQSGSMGAAAGAPGAEAVNLLSRARRTVEDLLATLGPQDELMLVPYDRAPHPTTPSPSSDLGRLRAAAQSLSLTASTTNHAKALEVAAAALTRSASLNRELFWISDFQTTGFVGPDGRETAPGFRAPDGPWDRSRVYLVPIAPRVRANVGLSDAGLAPTESDVALSVTARSFGAAAGDLAVEVRDARGDGELGRGVQNLPERGETSTLVPLARLPENGGVVRLPNDALELDNRRVFASGREGQIKVLLREDGAPSALRLALEAGSPASGLTVEAVDGAALATRARATWTRSCSTTSSGSAPPSCRPCSTYTAAAADSGSCSGAARTPRSGTSRCCASWARAASATRKRPRPDRRGGSCASLPGTPCSRGSPRGRASRSRARASARSAGSLPAPRRARCWSSTARIRP